jgi:protocatechuate 3,4-dioxygenase beta subunit
VSDERVVNLAEDVDPPLLYPEYRSTTLRAPQRPPIIVPHRFRDLESPVYGHDDIGEADNDLTRQHSGEPQGERIIVTGRVVEEDGRPVPNTLVEIWQANAGGRYQHEGDQHPAPLDPNFSGAGRTLTDADGKYEFVTQMYFPGDPLFEFDPIFQSVRDSEARARLIAQFELGLTQPEWALGYRFDIVLRRTPFE